MNDQPNQINTDEVDDLLQEWSNGNDSIENQLIELLYPHIHRIAHFQVKSDSASAMQTTEVVNEAFIKLSDQKTVSWQNKEHFLAIAAKVIRRVVINHYRAEYSQKRGGSESHMTLERIKDFIEQPNEDQMSWLELDQLLCELNELDSQAAQVVEYKIFGGLTIPEMAKIMSVSESTVSRNWQFARTWLLLQFESE